MSLFGTNQKGKNLYRHLQGKCLFYLLLPNNFYIYYFLFTFIFYCRENLKTENKHSTVFIFNYIYFSAVVCLLKKTVNTFVYTLTTLCTNVYKSFGVFLFSGINLFIFKLKIGEIKKKKLFSFRDKYYLKTQM